MKIRREVFNLIVDALEDYKCLFFEGNSERCRLSAENDGMRKRLESIDNNIEDKTKDNRISELENENYELHGLLRKHKIQYDY